jgi:hypothetical protein|tara:strand:- start:1293 stop:1706 length:414 start_codon:yes stop_codon:yes gene_type:complete
MAVLTSAEVVDQAESAYIQGTYKIALTYNLTPYTDAVSLATVETDEITVGDGGYARLSYTYTSSDLATYKNGQPFTEKTAEFVHDGSSTEIRFNHVVLLRDVSGTVTVVGFQTIDQVAVLTNGSTARIKINILHGAQ